ncbi:MAG: 2OG-Fe(II) oxygenase [Pseudomonadota bacterium]
MTSYLNLDAIAQSKISSEPYRFFQGANFLRDEQIDPIERDFPKLKNAGFLTLQEIQPEGAFAGFMEELQAPALTAAVSEALQFDLTKRPQLITIMRLCPKRAGRVHTDGKAKLATMLTYFNRTWPAGHDGAIRVVRREDDVNDYVVEVPPLMGNVFGFLRSDSSWHGHLPFEGERKVVQLTWLESEEAVERKKRNNALAQALKSLGLKKSAA